MRSGSTPVQPRRVRIALREALLLERQRELCTLTIKVFDDLAPLVLHLGEIERLVGLRGEALAGGHRDRPNDHLGITGNQDRSASWVRGRHSAHHAERHE